MKGLPQLSIAALQHPPNLVLYNNRVFILKFATWAGLGKYSSSLLCMALIREA